MVSSDLEHIEQLEKEIGRKLDKREFEEIKKYGQRGFALDENQQVIGLNLNGIKLDPVPAALSTFRHLQKLNLIGTQVKDISFLQGLSNLRYLDLLGNQITDISPLQKLKRLQHVMLWNNKIKQLPATLIELDPEIDVVSDGASSDDKKIFLGGNPLEKPPIEIIKQGKTAIRAYFDSLKEQNLPLNEVKVLLVGDGGAGKTSLVNRLLGLVLSQVSAVASFI
jgi:internalin A